MKSILPERKGKSILDYIIEIEGSSNLYTKNEIQLARNAAKHIEKTYKMVNTNPIDFILDFFTILHKRNMLGFSDDSNENITLISRLLSGKYDCDSSAFLVLMFAEIYKWNDIALRSLTDHVWVYFQGKNLDIQVFPIKPDEYYVKKYRLDPEDAPKLMEPLTGDAIFSIVFANLSNVLEKAGRTDEALQAMKDAIALNPNDPDYFTSLAYFYENSNLINDAKEAYKSALSIHRNDANALYQLGYIAMTEEHDYMTAYQYFKRLTDVVPDDTGALLNCATSLALMDCFENATNYLNKAISVDNKYKEAYVQRAKVKFHMSITEKDMQLIKDA